MSGQTHVVFGASGSLGAAMVRHLVAQGKPVRAFVRNEAAAHRLLPAEAELFVGDANKSEDVLAASRGAAVLYHTFNVAYQNWSAEFPRVTTNLLTAAKQSGSKLLFAGNVYGYGHFQQVPIDEQHPLAAHTKKGKLRNELEAQMWAAHHAGEVQVVIPRMPEFYGPNVKNPLISGIFTAALQGKKATWPTALDVIHELVYVDDAAAACALLADTASAYGQSWHVAGNGPITGRQFIELAFAQAGTAAKVGVMSQLYVGIGGLFMPLAREFHEMMYQFAEPYLLDGSKFAAAFPDFRFTPYAEGVQRTLAWYAQQPATQTVAA